MKTLFAYLTLVGLLFCFSAATPPAQPSTDVWVSKDPNTRSIVKMMFYDNRSRVRILASCSPNPCDWGVFSVRDLDPSGANSPSEGHPYEIIVNQNTARRAIRLIERGYDMGITMQTTFKDRRPANETVGELTRQF